ncbi:MAG TPA: hypothetical protein VK074_05435, partial [Fodinibius sp.]|nr:hypothetical protein [Fodinibius sp.]
AKYSIEEIIERHVEISANISQKIKPIKILNEYYQSGNYPYYFENIENYHQRLQQTISTILEVDLPAILNIDYSSVHKLKKLLYVLSTSVPFKPNITELSQKVGVARDTLLRYLHHLSEAHLILLLRSNKKGMSYMTKPEKIYLHNTNIMVSLADVHLRQGTIRETFFYNQLRCIGQVYDHTDADFLFDDKLVFEVGGKNKSKKQIQGFPDAYIVSDDIEVGVSNRIPLWLFGFLY